MPLPKSKTPSSVKEHLAFFVIGGVDKAGLDDNQVSNANVDSYTGTLRRDLSVLCAAKPTMLPSGAIHPAAITGFVLKSLTNPDVFPLKGKTRHHTVSIHVLIDPTFSIQMPSRDTLAMLASWASDFTLDYVPAEKMGPRVSNILQDLMEAGHNVKEAVFSEDVPFSTYTSSMCQLYQGFNIRSYGSLNPNDTEGRALRDKQYDSVVETRKQAFKGSGKNIDLDALSEYYFGTVPTAVSSIHAQMFKDKATLSSINKTFAMGTAIGPVIHHVRRCRQTTRGYKASTRPRFPAALNFCSTSQALAPLQSDADSRYHMNTINAKATVLNLKVRFDPEENLILKSRESEGIFDMQAFDPILKLGQGYVTEGVGMGWALTHYFNQFHGRNEDHFIDSLYDWMIGKI